MRLAVDDNRLVEKPRTQYYVWRWAVVIGIPIYIVVGILLGVFINSNVAGVMLIIVPMFGALAGLLGFIAWMIWDDLEVDIKAWLFERKT